MHFGSKGMVLVTGEMQFANKGMLLRQKKGTGRTTG
jgi:hypothetical protein